MSYLKRVLQPGEIVRHTAQIHWIVYWPAALALLAALASFAFGESLHSPAFGRWVGGFFGFVFLCLIVPEWFTWWTTEIAVTNHRVIHKTGLIRRTTNEMNMDKIESVRVDQSILGRILDYGDVTIIGTGEGETELKAIAKPLDLRNKITGVS